jgi:SOS regulatory protein LexA
MKKDYLQLINAFYKKNRRMPSYGELLILTGLKSKNAVYKIVQKYIDQDVLAKDASGKIIPAKMYNAVPVLGTVEAGFPSPAEEELIDTMTLDEYLIDNKEATYMLRASGTSMIDAGIMPGDIVLVERGKEARDGDIVIAEVDHKWTMKYLRKRRGKVYLEAANKNYPNIYPEEELNIAAVVQSVIRKYKK